MAETLNLGNGNWGVKKDSLLGYNSENGNFKPLAFNFTRASSATVVNKAGLIETVGSGEPRIDFSNDAKGALLLEPTRSNFVLQSNDFTGLNGVNVVTPNYSISLQGLSASRVLFTSSNQSISASTSLGIGVVCNFSAYVKGIQGEFIKFSAGGVDISHTFNGEWERLSGSATSTSNSWNFNTYGGATARDFLVSSAQLEQGSYATSYIPTQGSVVTRVADVCNNGANEQVFNSTEGVLYCYIYTQADNTEKWITISNSSNQKLVLYISSSNKLRTFVSGTPVDMNENIDLSIYNKIAFRYKDNSYTLFLNGIEIQRVNSGLLPQNFNVIDLARSSSSSPFNNFYGNTKDVRVYNTALTDAELINLTTL